MVTAMENGVVVFTAGEGMRLTDGESFVNTVRLGKEDSGERWYEITEEAADKLLLDRFGVNHEQEG